MAVFFLGTMTGQASSSNVFGSRTTGLTSAQKVAVLNLLQDKCRPYLQISGSTGTGICKDILGSSATCLSVIPKQINSEYTGFISCNQLTSETFNSPIELTVICCKP